MARFLLLAGIVCLFPTCQAYADEDNSLQNVLAVQKAMEQARFYLLQPDTKKAVEVLEEQLPRINGNANFLRLLRDAYRNHIKDLWLNNQEVLAKKYLDRLNIIDPAAAQDPVLLGKKRDDAAPAAEMPFPQNNGKHLFTGGLAKKQPTARAKQEDPFDLRNQNQLDGPNPLAQQFMTQAEQEFTQRRFTEARLLYEKAYQVDPKTIEPAKDRWAYCMLNHVVEQLNRPDLGGNSVNQLQKIVTGAVTMAPGLQETGTWLLREMDLRHPGQRTGKGPQSTPDAALEIKHLGRSPQGWQVAETPHFRIYHNQNIDIVEKVAQVAEQTRLAMFRKWFGHDGVNWEPKCDLFLHATAADYSKLTGVPAMSPGHSRIESDSSSKRVVNRRMDMRCDHQTMLETVLPHETTHVVLAGMFGPHAVPRWADEGIAVLTEPSDKVQQHRQNLIRSHQEGQLFRVVELLQMEDYPQPRRIGAFYAQSVSLVDFLTKQRGPRVLTEFLRDGLREGYELSLRRHYGWSFSDLETTFGQYVLGESQRLAGASFNR